MLQIIITIRLADSSGPDAVTDRPSVHPSGRSASKDHADRTPLRPSMLYCRLCCYGVAFVTVRLLSGVTHVTFRVIATNILHVIRFCLSLVEEVGIEHFICIDRTSRLYTRPHTIGISCHAANIRHLMPRTKGILYHATNGGHPLPCHERRASHTMARTKGIIYTMPRTLGISCHATNGRHPIYHATNEGHLIQCHKRETSHTMTQMIDVIQYHVTIE